MKSSRKKVLRYSYYRNVLCQLLFGTYKISCISDKKYNASVVIAIRRWSRTYYLLAKLFFDTQEDNFTIESPQTSD